MKEIKKLRFNTGTSALDLENASPAIIYSHADADGHLAAEQTRTNLIAEGVEVRQVVIGRETKNYTFWERTFAGLDLRQFRLVVVVDIAFSFREPLRSLESLLQTVRRHQLTQFIVIDHHPLMGTTEIPANLRLIEVESAYECCLGVPSDDFMVVAAICDGDGKVVRSRISNIFVKRALGIRRAAADVEGMVGTRLSSLLRSRKWEFFESLAEEPAEFHRNARGRRTSKSLISPLLEAAKNGAI